MKTANLKSLAMTAFKSLFNRMQQAVAFPASSPVALMAVLLSAGIANSTATVIYDSGGFESPRFLASQSLAGQDPTPPPVGYGPWHQDTGASTAVVQTDVPNGGLQSVKITRVAGSAGDTRWGVNVPITPSVASNVVAIDFDMSVTISPGTNWGGPDLGPLFGVECYDSSSGAPKLIGSVFLDAYAGDVVYQQATNGALQASATFIPRNEYHHYTLAANFATKTCSIYVDGNLVHTEGFVDPTAVAFSDAPMTTLAATPESVATAAGTAYFDNYTISATTSLLNYLVWRGDGVNNVWDTGTSNWFDGNGLVVFSNNVPAIFDDSGSSTPSINLQGTLQPASITVNAAQDYTFSGSGSLAGIEALLKRGSGTLALENNNIYSGGTTVSDGTLLINNNSGSATGTGPVSVAAGATLGGTGIIGGDVTVADSGTLAPGNNAGTLTINSNLTLAGDAVLQYALGGASSRLAVGGNLNLSGVLNISDAGGFAPGTYNLINYGGTLSGPGLFIYQAPSGFIYNIDTNTPGSVNLIVGSPSSLAGAPIGLTATPVSDSQVDLAWTPASTNATAFLIERSINDYTFTQIASVDGSTTNYADTGLSPNTTYYYRVRAGNSGGDSPYSVVVAASTGSLVFTTNGTWIATSGGNWNTTSNWLGGAIAFGSGGSADFSGLALPTNLTVTLDAPVTINALKFGDTSASYNWTLGGSNALTLGTSPNINVVNQSATISTPVISTAGLTKTGPGNLTLGGASNSMTGGVALDSGSVTLDFTAPGSPAADIIPSTNGLTLGGSALQILGNSNSPSSQTFASTTLNDGESVIAAAPGSGANNPTVNLAILTANSGGVVEFNGPATVSAGGSNITATATVTTANAGFIGSAGDPFFAAMYATVGLYDFATTNLLSTNVIGGSQVLGFYTPGSGTTVVTSGNLDVSGNISGWAAQPSLTSMRFNASLGADQTVTVNYNIGNVLTIGDVLVTPNVGSYNVIYNGGVFRPGGGNSSYGGPLVIWQNNPAGELILNPLLGNSKAGSAAYVQAGPGTVSITGTGNLYTGQSYLDGGVTLIAGNGSIGSASANQAVNLSGGSLIANGTFALDNGGTGRAINLLNNGGGLAVTAENTFTVDGLVGSAAVAGPLTIGIPASSANNNSAGLLPGTGAGTANPTPVYATGTVVLNNANYFTGGTVLQSGTLNINGINALGGANYGGLTFNGGTLQYAIGLNNGSADLTSIGTEGVTLAAGGGTIDLNGNYVTYAGPIGNGGGGGLTVESSQAGGTLILGGNNSYAGDTLVTNAALYAENYGGSATGSGDVTLANNAVLSGTGSLAGSVTVEPGAMLAPGAPLGTMTIGRDLTLTSGSTALFQIQHSPLFNSSLNVSGALTKGGTLVVTNIGSDALAIGDTFRLLSASNYAGAFSSLALPPLPSNLMWNTNELINSGVLTVVSAVPVSVAVAAQVQNGNIVLAGSGGPVDGTYYVFSTTNLALPLAQWICEATNQFDNAGNFGYTNAVDPNSPGKFFILQLP